MPPLFARARSRLFCLRVAAAAAAAFAFDATEKIARESLWAECDALVRSRGDVQ